MRKDLKLVAHAIILAAILIILLALRARELSTYTFVRFAMVIVFGYIATLFDISQKRIPNGLILGMFAVWILLILLMFIHDIPAGVEALTDSMFGILVGGGVFIVVYFISKKGLGGGDVKFMAAAGLYLGLSKTIPAIFYGTILAALVGFTLVVLKKITKKDKIPLAPFLFVGIAIAVFT
ncbi:MAG: A24 family peptidase [Oscillospiraceae bacterium]|nr:A24 family peptidase [Oscillospiraceae bacterium]MCL2278878.1 A24 family peptidase [Oscillospiraceae bacterium]